MKNIFSRLKKLGSRGDTLVEVLISIAIITLVVAVGYTVANRSLQNGTSASQRNQALSLAQGQVEQLVNAVNSNNIDAYKVTGHAFCINPNDPTTPIDATSGACNNFNGQPYNLNVSYDDKSGIYTVKATWSQATGNKSAAGSEGQLTLYYKAPGLFTGTDVCPNLDGIQTTVPNGWHLNAQGNCVNQGNCDPSVPGSPCSPPPVQTASSPPNCQIHSVVPNPPNPPGINGDCSGGHCGSPGYPGGCNNAVTVCDDCACTVSITDYNYQGTSSAVVHYWNCPDRVQPPNPTWPDPGNGSLNNPAANACPPPTYGTATDLANGNCGTTPYCSMLNDSAGQPMYGTYPHCYSAPSINSAGNTVWPPCNNYADPDPNNPNCTSTTTTTGGTNNGAGGSNSCPAGQTWDGTQCVSGSPTDTSGQCATGYHWNGATCVTDGSSGGGFCHQLNFKNTPFSFGLMGWLTGLLPFHNFAYWC